MIPGDISALLAVVLREAAANGTLPVAAAGMTAAGTWRSAPAAAGGGPGTYSTFLPFALARLADGTPAAAAALLAARLGAVAGIATAEVTGSGYLTVTVTEAALAGLAPRIVLAGPGCARSGALADTRLAAPPRHDLAVAVSWPQAWRWQGEEAIARLAAAAGAVLTPLRKKAADAPPSRPAGPAGVAAAIEYAGADAVRYALTRTAAGRRTALERAVRARRDLSNPLFAVCLGHAEAAAALRRAADLGVRRAAPGQLRPGLLADPRERELLDVLSWLPERVAGAGRRGRPHELAAYLEQLAAGWADCREGCPALPFGGQPAARTAEMISARLWLADAVRTVLAAGLRLIGVTAPQRL